MTFTTVPSKSTGDLLEAADWNTYIRDNETDLDARLQAIEFSGGQWSRSTNQSIPDSTLTLLTFPDSEDLDVGGWGLTASNSLITVPSGAIPSGYTNIRCLVHVRIAYDPDADGYRYVELLKNGTKLSGGSGRIWPTTSNSLDMGFSIPVSLVAADTISAQTQHTAGASLNVNAGFLAITRVGPY